MYSNIYHACTSKQHSPPEHSPPWWKLTASGMVKRGAPSVAAGACECRKYGMNMNELIYILISNSIWFMSIMEDMIQLIWIVYQLNLSTIIALLWCLTWQAAAELGNSTSPTGHVDPPSTAIACHGMPCRSRIPLTIRWSEVRRCAQWLGSDLQGESCLTRCSEKKS